jgi:hypothetical protein
MTNNEVAVGIICNDLYKPEPEIINIIWLKEQEAERYCDDYNSKNNLSAVPDEYYVAERLKPKDIAKFAKAMLS